jgi:hypothetical protein
MRNAAQLSLQEADRPDLRLLVKDDRSTPDLDRAGAERPGLDGGGRHIGHRPARDDRAVEPAAGLLFPPGLPRKATRDDTAGDCAGAAAGERRHGASVAAMTQRPDPTSRPGRGPATYTAFGLAAEAEGTIPAGGRRFTFPARASTQGDQGRHGRRLRRRRSGGAHRPPAGSR